ncbi:hypothetical protein D6817_01190 [Candidatus Pacearchaeota archaeon]|nr:MAG: hypothetical protein D6817_01190 [Candidatus Pacearchaeota archaeon]
MVLVRKLFLVVVLGFVLFLSFAHAQVQANASGDGSQTPDSAGELAREIRGSLNGTDAGSIRKSTNDFLSKDVQLPESLQVLTRIFFGLRNDEKVDLERFMILLAMFVFVFLLVYSALEMFARGIARIALALAVTALAGISRGIFYGSQFFFSVAEFFGILKGWRLVSLLISLTIIVVLGYFLAKLLAILKEHAKNLEAESTGRKIGEGAAAAEIQRNAMEELSERGEDEEELSERGEDEED